ncbi:unnamed protein product [Pedinophyceae sp. YPF-701]|nr:unnamed protein product [Pedinophyceae sp. YPF-701]
MAGSSRGPAILYSLVARESAVLCEHVTDGMSGNCGVVAQQILTQLDISDVRSSYAQDRHSFHILQSDGLVFLCMTQSALSRGVAFAFLQDVRDRFMQAHGEAAATALAYSLNTDFSPVLRERMVYFSTTPGLDRVAMVKGELDNVKSIMLDNIDRVLARGERIDTLVEKTDHLAFESLNFRSEARRLHRTMRWQQVRYMMLMGVGGVGLLYVLIAMFCGFSLSHC